MKKNNFLAVCLLVLLTMSSVFAEEKTLDNMIAIVNDEVITTSEVQQATNIVKIQYRQAGVTLPAEKILEKQVLEQLINKKLQLQIAKQAGIKITNDELNNMVQTIAKQNNISPAQFYQQLAAEGMSKAAYLQEMREQLTIQKLQQQEVYNRIQISKEELKQFAKSLPRHTGKTITSYTLQDILIPVTDNASSQDINNLHQVALKILKKLQAGRSVQAATKDSSPAVQIINFDNKTLAELPSAFVNPLAHVKKNDIAGPIKTGNGFHLLRIVELQKNQPHMATPSRQELGDMLGKRKYEEALQDWLAKLRSQAYIVNKLNG